jgi:hypothetical protein
MAGRVANHRQWALRQDGAKKVPRRRAAPAQTFFQLADAVGALETTRRLPVTRSRRTETEDEEARVRRLVEAMRAAR